MTEEQMRSFIVLAESLNGEFPDDDPLVESAPEETGSPLAAILHDLGEVAFRLRGFMESSSGEYALGVETGMQRAAEMIDNVITRYNQGDDR